LTPPLRRSLACLALLAATIPFGLAIRMAPLGLPYPITKYGGSILWAAALYWLIAALLPKLTATHLALIATLTSIALELSRLWHTPATDAFRLTLAGKLLLGRLFSLKNIAAYAVAIALTALADHYFHPGRSSP